MNKILFSAVISAILSVNADAADLLASVTNGKISDNSHGAKVLSLDEAKQVKGGYSVKWYKLHIQYDLSKRKSI